MCGPTEGNFEFKIQSCVVICKAFIVFVYISCGCTGVLKCVLLIYVVNV